MEVNSCPKEKSGCERCSKASPGVLLPSAAPAVEGDDLVSADAGFANWTHLSVRSGLQPLQAGEKNAFYKCESRTSEPRKRQCLMVLYLISFILLSKAPKLMYTVLFINL